MPQKLGYTHCISNNALNRSLDNESCQRTNDQIYINGILTPENVEEYITMKKLCV